MRPIPRGLLIHRAVLKRPATTDTFQAQTYTETELNYVRFDPYKRTSKTKENTERVLSTTMFYDCINSRPRGLDFHLGDRIISGGTEYEVKSIEHLHDNRGLHHIELGLM